MENQKVDLFGEPIIEDVLLRDKFIEPPFSILDTKSGSWQNRKKQWQRIGMKSEVGRDSVVINMDSKAKEKNRYEQQPQTQYEAACNKLSISSDSTQEQRKKGGKKSL